jgi:hypothetical protein
VGSVVEAPAEKDWAGDHSFMKRASPPQMDTDFHGYGNKRKPVVIPTSVFNPWLESSPKFVFIRG